MAYFLQLHSTVKIEENPTGALVVSHPGGALSYSPSFSASIQQILLLLKKGATETQLIEIWERFSDSQPLTHFFYVLNKLHQHHILSYTVSHENRPLARLDPFPGFSWDQQTVSHPKKRLSRFACLRRENESFFLESPLAHARIEILDPIGFQIIASLGKGLETEDLTAENQEFIELLEKGGFLENENPSLGIWEFHDLFFHSRSRRGRCDASYGGTFRFLSEMPPFPPIRPMGDQPLIPLKKTLSDSPPFYEVLEKRRSLREYGEQAITIEQLGEFLFRTAAVRAVGPGKEYAPLFRTTPSGGACHPIEIYPLIANCSGISPGLYRYEREQHALSLLAPLSKEMEGLLSSPNKMLKEGSTVQVLFIFTARFGRTFWKYERMGYATILKDVGALMQTMYLVATAMGLAPCANGGGDSDLFEKVSGLDYFEEGSVGEFVLGSQKD